MEQLAKHSDAGRFHSQDAVLQPRTRDPYAMLTLPEFIQEPMPCPKDAQAMLALSEDEQPPSDLHNIGTQQPISASGKAKKKIRNRSLSAPPLSWLRSSSSRSGLNNRTNISIPISTSHSRSHSRGQNAVPNSKRITNIKCHYICSNYLLMLSGVRCALCSRESRKFAPHARILNTDRCHAWRRC